MGAGAPTVSISSRISPPAGRLRGRHGHQTTGIHRPSFEWCPTRTKRTDSELGGLRAARARGTRVGGAGRSAEFSKEGLDRLEERGRCLEEESVTDVVELHMAKARNG